MITEKEIEEARLSPTKKDYYQIWNELMEMTTKLSEIWNPSMTNESDPGVVLLKVLTGVGDKLSYNIDKATLEHFLPSATQVESVRALCETLGYSMKYYRGATCDVNISFNSSSSVDFDKDLPDGVWFPKFTNIKNIDMDVNYVTLEEFTLSLAESRSIPCIEGALVECISDNDNIITLAQLDTQNRFIFPESNVAENGVFVTNIVNGGESSPWEQVDNLNARIMGSKVYKFGFDSKRRLPYIQFTDEISNLIEDGLKISYIRTNGYTGNVSANTLTVLEPPAIWATSSNTVINKLTAEDFAISNYAASLNGQDPETIDSAYVNFKKTVGTFDTLVACRDYIAAIYKMTVSDYNPTPLVSAINVTDIRDDINSALPLCSFSEYGIKYSDRSVQHYEFLIKTNETKVWSDLCNKFGTLYKYVIPTGDTAPYYAPIVEADLGGDEIEIFRSCSAIDRFDLILYPFYTIYNVNNKTEFDKSFKFGTEYSSEIIANLGENKTLAHNIKFGNYTIGNIAAIKNYVRLHCKVTTVRRVTPAEERELLDNIYKALYANFNARQVDFGEEIPYDSLVKVIMGADNRIKDIMLDDPTLITKILSTDNQEYELAAADSTSLSQDAKVANALFNRLALRNVLAGKIAAFDYNTDFVSSYTETKYDNYATSYPEKSESGTPIITSIESSFDLPAQDKEYKLEENEVIRFTLPNFKTTKIFPAYVNYYFRKNTSASSNEVRPAKMESILDYLSCTNKANASAQTVAYTDRADTFMRTMKTNNYLEPVTTWKVTAESDVIDTLDKLLAKGEVLYIVKEHKDEDDQTVVDKASSLITKLGGGASDLFIKTDGVSKFNKEDFVTVNDETPVTIYKLVVDEHISAINNYFIDLEKTDNEIKVDNEYSRGLYIRKSQKIGATAGSLIDEDGWKYVRCTTKVNGTSQYTQYFVPMATYDAGEFKYDGLGKDPIYKGEANNTDYLLGPGDYLLINYTSSTTDAEGNETKQVHNEVYESTSDKPVYIKANFELIDSREYHQTHSYSKEDKNGQEFNFDINYLGPNEGMFTLGSNEQIEIREPVRVELGKLDDPKTGETDSGIWNICWTRQDDNNNMLDLSQIEFVYDEWINIENETRWTETGSLSTDKTGNAYNAYTLKSGEYFYVTDSKKQNLIYYGSGTTIVRHKNTPRFIKLAGDIEPSAADVANYGLAASLPFHTYMLKNPSAESETKRSIIIQENQMIVLTEGDTLLGLQAYKATGDIPDNATNSPTQIETGLSTDKPISVYSARYKFAEAEVAENLPKAPGELKWTGTSTLDININPDKPQKLNAHDMITINFNNGTSQELTADSINGKLTLYSSYPCVTANSVLGTELRDNNGNLVDYGLKLRVSKTIPVNISNSALNMNNYSNKWTKINFANYKEICNGERSNGTFDLQIGISSTDKFGLIMFYYINKTENKTSGTSTPGTSTSTVSQCTISATGGNISLMADNTAKGVAKIELSPGEKGTGKLSIIKVDKEVTKLTITPDTNFSGILVFGQLDAVKDINPKLDYRVVSEQSALDQLLADIKRTNLADEFYYNVPVEAAQAIDLNASVDDEKLSSPATWYDNNNVNKKFVISEIDTNYLSTGITLTKQSRG